MAKLPPTSSSAASASSSGDPTTADGGREVEDSVCVARRLRASTLAQRPRSQCHLSQLSAHIGDASADVAGPSSGSSTAAAAARKRRSSAPTGSPASSTADPAAAERAPKRARRGTSSSVGRRSTATAATTALSAGENPQPSASRAGAARRRGVDGSASGGAASQLRASHSQRRFAEQAAPSGETSGGAVNRRRRGRAPGRPRSTAQARTTGGPPPPPALSTRHQLLYQLPAAASDSSTAPAATTGSCASSSHSGRRGGGRAGGKLATLDSSAAAAGAGSSLATAADGRSAAAASTSAAAVGGAAAASSATGEQQAVAGAAGAGSGAALLDAAAAAAAGGEEEGDMGRLQALLEARGIPPHLLGALGPRMQQMLHRSMGSSSKIQQLVAGLQATGDETQQLQAAIEMGQLLVMGNEETLAGFPIKQVVPPLVILLQMEHNFDMMNHACRALTYLMEALPRSTAAVVEAVPALLQKLQSIQCMDVAEQALSALELISRRHSKNILQVGGISSCLMYVDFFSITAQRAALAITSNCCLALSQDEFQLVQTNLPALSQRLTHQDKKTVESVCIAFSRLVDTFKSDPSKVKEIAGNGLLYNVQQLLISSPPIISSSTFCEVTKMLRLMCSHCPELGAQLLTENIAETLCVLLVSNKNQMELVSRNPEELYALMCLVGELLPSLPTDGLFTIDQWLLKVHPRDIVHWQWRDDRGTWHNYSQADSFSIESSSQSGADEAQLLFMGRHYSIDLNNMRQINESTGTSRPVLRRTGSSTAAPAAGPPAAAPAAVVIPVDPRLATLQADSQLFQQLVRTLFSVLYKVYSSCAGPAVRHTSLRAILRMVYFASPDMLKELVSIQDMSSHLTGMLSSGDLKIVVAALQLAEVLIQKLPEQCDLHFRREGVVYQINQLSRGDPTTTSGSTSSAAASSSGSTYSALSTPSSSSAIDGSVGGGRRAPELCAAGPSTASLPAYLDTAAPQQAHGTARHQYPLPVPSTSAVNSAVDPAADAPANLSLSDVLKRKRTSKRAGNPSRRCRQEEASAAATAASASSSSVPASMAYSALETLSRGSGSSRSASASGGAFSSQFRAGKSSTPAAAASLTAASSSAPTAGGGSSSASRFQASFLASLNPARWGRTGGSTSAAGRGGAGSSGLVASSGVASGQSGSLLNRTASGASLAGQRERVRAWIRQRARQFIRQYFSGDTSGRTPAIARLDAALKQLRTQPKQPLTPLNEISSVVCQSDISPFEVLQSGLVAGLTDFLTAQQYSCPAAAPTAAAATASPRADRLRAFLHVFAGCSCQEGLDGPPPPQPLPQQTAPLSALVAKLQACLSQAEQLLVKVHDVAEATGGVSGQSALRYFNQNQLKCNLYRWPDCSSLRQWRGGPVKIDPLALVQAIERYLVIRGYGRVRDEDDDASDDADSEEDIDDTMQAAVSISQGSNHRLQFVINGHVLPYNMTVFQAIQQYSRDPAGIATLDPDSEHTVGSAHLFQRTHTIYYRPAPDDDNSASSSSGLSAGRSSSSTSSSHHAAATAGANKRGKGGSSGASTKSAGGGTGKRRDELWTDGVAPEPLCPLQALLTPALPNPPVTICDPCLPTLNLLRVLNALSRFHGQLYQMPRYTPLIPPQEFINHKVAAKANRQLQDPVIIMTGNSPQWLHQIGITCPFLLPFDTRQLLFHSCTFDRDRALLRLIDASPELQTADGDDRIAPKLERKKRSVARDDLLRQAETLMSELSGSRAMLEVQYDGEVGSGLGPTLEFYSQVSHEMQRADLGLWRGERSRHAVPPQIAALTGDHKPAAVVGADGFSGGSSSDVETAGDAPFENSWDDATGPEYVVSPLGLYPIPLGRSCKSANLSRIKAKYRFLGKLMAKALMDSRLLDLPLSAPFYRWLLRQERCLSGADLAQLDPTLAQSLAQLQLVVRRRRSVELTPAVSVQARADAIEALSVDGCSITDLGLEFTLPGHPAIELKRTGKDQSVTVHNLEQYLKLLTHWLLYESVYRQMEAFREGFESVFPIDNLAMFQPDEMDFLFCGSQESCWDAQTLRDAFRPDHGYTHESPAIRNLISILAEFSYEERRCFLSFVTGSPRLPVGGFRSLTPPLTIVRKIVTAPENADDMLPSVMTCVNYLKLPDYSSRQLMRRRLITAVRDGRLSFMLS